MRAKLQPEPRFAVAQPAPPLYKLPIPPPPPPQGPTAGLLACYLCHEKFLDLEHLSGHLYNVHKQQLTHPTCQPFSCGLCDAKFNTHSQLMIHSQHHCSTSGIVGLKSS
ncbi:hypothetical protein SK128_010585 [Halocaridina rubra]|uniref:C2H2-type domain-containing protein n=1 Tax=Halocaridina rubra TaxID=373956 RepID=A0AAN8W957_HALRR